MPPAMPLLPPPRVGEPPAANDEIWRHRGKEARPTAILNSISSGRGVALNPFETCG
ncbi:hypothetical protein TIFTF001_025168 [Ficus carica]|uniref:Uncharacterized protein n=1 Tax=Ficus carica TaxID=3494 RepID=A0AA88AQV4_FICCA|nr:hypothetical protein TIFTF001_025168 [Ficus carica]